MRCVAVELDLQGAARPEQNADVHGLVAGPACRRHVYQIKHIFLYAECVVLTT